MDALAVVLEVRQETVLGYAKAATTGPVQGTATGPAFIFGRRNANYRAGTSGQSQSDPDAEATVAELTAALQKELGRKPTPTEVQREFRRQLMARVRGQVLAQMMQKAGVGADPPSAKDFAAEMDKWRSSNLETAMSGVNKALGTKGAGYRGTTGFSPARRAGWEARLQARVDAAAKRWTAARLAERSSAQKASLALRDLVEPAIARTQGRLAAFLATQRADVIRRLEARAEQVARKPADADLYWDEAKWNRDLEALLAPVVEQLVDVATAEVGLTLKPAGKAAPVNPAIKRLGARIKGINATTRKEIVATVKTGMKEGLSMQALGQRIRESTAFSSNRAETIARTETGTALNQGQVEAFRSYGVEHVTVSDGDKDAECARANGAIWTIDEALANPLEHPNCVRDFAPIVGDVAARGQAIAPAATPTSAPVAPTPAGLNPALNKVAGRLHNMERMPAHYQEEVAARLTDLEARTGVQLDGLAVSNAKELPPIRGNMAVTVNGRLISYSASQMADPAAFEALSDYAVASGWSAATPGLTNIESLTAHEWGHMVDARLFGGLGGGPGLPVASHYAAKDYAERFAEAFAQWYSGADTPAARWIGERLAEKGIV